MKSKQTHLFVNYISRSGSTLLCSMLDQYQDIAVGIEAGFPGFPNKILPNSKNPLTDKEAITEYLDTLFNDKRFLDWNIDRTKLTAALINKDKPIVFSDILDLCCQAYFNEQNVNIITHKSGYFTNDLSEVRKQFPSAFHLYIIRDPRAVFASQKSAQSIYNNSPMASNIYRFAKEYRYRYLIAKENKDTSDFIFIQFESLLKNASATIDKIIKQLGISNKKKASNYKERIPESQQNLHGNVGKELNVNINNKWKQTLAKEEIYILEILLKDVLCELNYKKYYSHPLHPIIFFKSLVYMFKLYF